MKLLSAVAVALLMTGVAVAKDPPVFQKGVLLQMDSAACGYAEKGGKTIAGEVLGTDSSKKNTKEVLCQEYVLQTDRVIYRIRPKDDKHPLLLPIGETVAFRISKDTMKLHVPEMDDKDREYIVVSMTMRAEASDSQSAKNLQH